MNIAVICISAVMVSAPAENYCAEISPEISAEIITCIINGEYRQHIDYNGDGNLNIADVVSVSKRYSDNCKYGNEITLTSDTVYDIAMENYSDELIYWEIDRVNGNLTRQYELTASEIMTAEIYMEFENYSECVTVEVNPFTETITVID